MNQYSITSNRIKLFKHLPKLQKIQDYFARRVVSPIMCHVVVTNKCNMNCNFCCFANREPKDADMPWEMFTEAVRQFEVIGMRSYEITGGGEPTFWPYLRDAIDYVDNIAVMTNGMNDFDYTGCQWVRLSMNALDYGMTPLLPNVKTSFNYIWNELSPQNIHKVAEFAEKHKVTCRIAPDCIIPPEGIGDQMDVIREYIKPYKYLFLSDFNINIKKTTEKCYMHLVKPLLHLDGWLYACPSSELALENNKTLQPRYRVCRYDEIIDYYSNPKIRTETCSYCKYVEQNQIIEDLITETDNNDYA